MSSVVHTLKDVMTDIGAFSSVVLGAPLRPYQAAPLRAVLDSILNCRGLEFLLVFPRQSGKNEAVAQLLAYLLNFLQPDGGNVVYGAAGDQLGLGIERLERHLDNALNAGWWTRKTRPTRRCLGRASVVFLSSHLLAQARGQTAHHLLVLDETQDQNGPHIEAVFTPMRAANNATALYIGTVKSKGDYLWQKKTELEGESERDGIRRVFMVHPETVCQEVPAYRHFLNTQVRKHGRNHPIVASEYFLEPIDAAGGLFPARRLRQMQGDHPRLRAPVSGEIYAATLDVAGEDEGATDPAARLHHPGRDYTVAHVFRVRWPGPGTYQPGPTYEAVDVFVDHGSKHFQADKSTPTTGAGDLPAAGTALVHRLVAWLQSWGVAHLVADASGVGQGMVSWLSAALGAQRVTGYGFAARGQKARLGTLFLSLVETRRFRYWTGDEEVEGSDGWWFWRQAEACSYELPAEGQLERHLRWGVPSGHRTPTATGLAPTHDDRLVSAALVAHLDRLVRECAVALGRAESVVIQPRDPLAGLRF
jgi:hypothetical protein